MSLSHVIRRHVHLSSVRLTHKLSKEQVTGILEHGELSYKNKAGSCVVRRVDTNQLPANLPCEDRYSQHCGFASADHIFGVYDGHGGVECAGSVSRRLPAYIAAATLSPAPLKRHLAAVESGAESMFSLLEQLKGTTAVSPATPVELSSYIRYLRQLLASTEVSREEPHRALSRAFLHLDGDIGREALSATASKNSAASHSMLATAESGCVACVAHVRAGHVHVASAGDCRAVLGVQGEGGRWTARTLSTPHTCENSSEVQRIRDAHPSDETTHVLSNGRLLGLLAPLRAFGDFRFKWTRQQQQQLLADLSDSLSPESALTNFLLPGFHTPPYLTAAPDVCRHKLTPRDRFLLMASDGLWDMLSVEQAVELVGLHADGKTSLAHFKLPLHRRVSTAVHQLTALLQKRRRSLGRAPEDRNAATHTLRHALSGSSLAGLNIARISQLLQLPVAKAREYRDDITIMVIMFDTDFLEKHV